jgi:hypothetical protein
VQIRFGSKAIDPIEWRFLLTVRAIIIVPVLYGEYV